MRPTERNASNPGNRSMDNLLRELDELQARESIPDIEPPQLVDQAVRNMARRELQKPAPSIAGKLRWIAGLSTVSVALLAIGISMVQSPRLPPPTAPNSGVELPELKQESAPPPAAEFRAKSDAPMPAATLKQVPGNEGQAEVAPEKMRSEAAASNAMAVDEAAREVYESSLSEVAAMADQVDADSTQAWLDLVQQLYEQGLVTEAQEQLRAFITEHPEHELPDWALQLQQAQD